MRILISILFCLCLCALPVGCSKNLGGNAGQSGGKTQRKGSGDAKADLMRIWEKMTDWYRKTGQPTPPSEIPDGLAEVYNYQHYFEPKRGSKDIVAYETKPTNNGKRFALHQDGVIEQLTDSELSALGVVADDPLTEKERLEREKEGKRKLDESVKNFLGIEDAKEKQEKAKRELEQIEREAEKARQEMDKKQKDFAEKQNIEREQQIKDFEKQRQEMEKKRKDFDDKQKKLGEDNTKVTTLVPRKPRSREKETPLNTKLTIRTSV